MTETEIKFPRSIEVKALQEHSPEYQPKRMERHRLLYVGGQDFHDCIEEFLVKRQIEKSSTDAGRAHWEYRKARAWYINRCSGLIDWLVAEVRKNEPRIVAASDPDGYWESLNKDADGFGHNLSSLVGKVLIDIFLHRRGFFGVHFPAPFGKPLDKGTLDARIRVMPAEAIRDWSMDEFGNLAFCRYDTFEPIRPKVWEQPEKELGRWTFFTADQVASYRKERKIGTAFPHDAKAYIDKEASAPHSFGVCPIFPAVVDQELWVMNKIEDPVVALYNREVATTFGLDATAYQMLMLKLQDRSSVNKLVASELSALVLDPQDDASFLSPDSTVFAPLFQDAERLKQALYEVLQTLAANAMATQGQNARQAASAKEIDLAPMSTLLESYAWPVRNALERMITAIKNQRGEEDNEVTLEGLDEFDPDMEDAEEVLGVKKEDGGKKPEEKKPEKRTYTVTRD